MLFDRSHKMEVIGTLAGGIAHQFNNALSGITGNIDMLELVFPDEEKIAAYTKPMKDSANRMALLTDQLLAYARGGKYQARTLSLSDFMRDTLPLIRHTIDPVVSVDTDIPRDIFSIKADMTQMQMALSAILTNASESMAGKGRIRVTCGNETITDETITDFPDFKPGDYVRLTIEDNGKGMDEETRSRIFEPFFTTKFQGRGLGMAAAYGIIKNHDGWILVDSELDKGTTVHIYLPAVEALVKEPKKPKIKRNSSINRGKDSFQPYFHRRGAENAKKFLFLFFAERAKSKKSYLPERSSLFLGRPLNGKGKNIILSALCVFAVESLFIRMPLFIEKIRSNRFRLKVPVLYSLSKMKRWLWI